MSSASIVLATMNARYSHASFGLRCLRANLGRWREDSVLVEGIIKDHPLEFVSRVLASSPRIVGLGVYIWNARPMLDVVRLLKKIAPDVVVVIGGPEVSHEIEEQEICALADHVVTQEGELAFASLCEHYLGDADGPKRLVVVDDEVPLRSGSLPHIIEGGAPPIGSLALAYDEYTDVDLAERIIYIEASRGCPFRCAFCLSALDKKVRPIEESEFFAALDGLYARGLRQFKFVDRTFNLDLDFAVRILRFFDVKREVAETNGDNEGLFLHFEMVPDRLPAALISELARFPPGAVQLEVGLQTFNPDVAKILERRTDFDKACENISMLREKTGVHIHADLIAGLPLEDLKSFGRGFDRLVLARPHEIQLGILKRLRGFPLASKDVSSSLVFDHAPPYEILRTDHMAFDEMMHIRQVAKVWDLAFNQGRFPSTCSLFLTTWAAQFKSAFTGLRALTDAVIAHGGTTFGLSMLDLAHAMYVEMLRLDIDEASARTAMEHDFVEGGKRKTPPFLDPQWSPKVKPSAKKAAIPARQQRHTRTANSESA